MSGSTVRIVVVCTQRPCTLQLVAQRGSQAMTTLIPFLKQAPSVQGVFVMPFPVLVKSLYTPVDKHGNQTQEQLTQHELMIRN